MGEYKIIKCFSYGPTATLDSTWYEVHKLKKFLWFERWEPIKDKVTSGPHASFWPVRFKTIGLAEKCVDRLQAHKPNTTAREDVPLDIRQ